jgi:hypothetical protein
MKIARRIALLMGLGFGLMAWPHFAAAQTCKDEQSMLEESKKDLTQLVTTVKQESLPDFEKSYHQKSVVNKLTFLGFAVQSLLTCLEKVEQDPAASKEIVEASKAQHENYEKLKEKIQHDLDALKALTTPKDAKVFAGKLDEAT